ncbi:MAG TPA: peptidoglycan DD-metalloendopeptidase family protein [Alphaproteobacteria bacterium]
MRTNRPALFSERQIIVRSPRGMRFVRLSPAVQWAAVASMAFVACALGWFLNMHVDMAREARYARVLTERLHAFQQAAAGSGIHRPEAGAAEPLTKRVEELERRLAESEAARQRLEAEHKRVIAEKSATERRVKGANVDQDAVAKLIEQAKELIERGSRSVSQLGLDVERLLAAGRSHGGAGGPFIQVPRTMRTNPSHAELAQLGKQVNRLVALRRALQALPVGVPLTRYQIGSPFGVRRDPLNGELAMHNGIDLVAPPGTAVLAAARGKVTIAARSGQYGNLVEIDHGFGLRTRYGHLSRIAVRPGQTVGPRTQIGAVGSTGRGTGPHLHYEVLFKGKAIDPKRFLEARAHVFQI